MDELFDDDTGNWQVTTETSTYHLDLSQRRLLRVPDTGAGADPNRGGGHPGISRLPGDHHYLPLVHVVVCRVGTPMFLLTEPHGDGTVGWRIATRVQQIRALDPPEGAPRRKADEPHQ